MEIRRH